MVDAPYRHLLERADLRIGIDRPGSGYLLDVDAYADVQHLPVRTAVADLALCTEVIEHVPDDRQLVEELARVLRPKGRLLISGPFVHAPHELPHDYRRLTARGLQHLLEGSGFGDLRMSAVGGSGTVVIDLCLRAMDRLGRRIGTRLGVPDLVERASRCIQRVAGETVLLLGREGLRVDPTGTQPRLTLGYVVCATRLDGAPSRARGA